MKKLISFICITMVLLSMSLPALAGDIPESLIWNDEAQIFFGEIIDYYPDKDEPSISVSPVKKIKGDVNIGSKQIYLKPNPMGGAEIVEGNVYLCVYYDAVNTFDIFEVTSYDTKTLKVKGIQGDMWERFEEYINNGEYERAEVERSQVPFVEFLDITREQSGTVTFSFDGKNYEIGVKEFFDIAENITLTDVENEIVETNAIDEGIFITINKNINGGAKFASITLDGYVDRYSLMMSRLPVKDLKMSDADFEKICSLLPVKVPIVKNVNAADDTLRSLPLIDGGSYIIFQNIMFAWVLPFIIGAIIRLIFIKWKKGYIISGVFVVAIIGLWIYAKHLVSHGVDGTIMLLPWMATMLTVGSLLVGCISLLVRKLKK